MLHAATRLRNLSQGALPLARGAALSDGLLPDARRLPGGHLHGQGAVGGC